MYKSVLVATTVGAAVLTTVATPHATFATSGDTDNTKVTICHRTDSATNPYVKITVSASAAYGGHDDEHNGPIAGSLSVAAKLKSQHVKWGDIIPGDATHQGQNWTIDGKVIFDNNCDCDHKTGPIVVPLENKGNDKDTSCDSKTPTTTTPGKGGDVTPSSTSTPAVTASISTPTATVSELPHTGTGVSTLVVGGIVSFLAGIATYGGRFIRARFLPQL